MKIWSAVSAGDHAIGGHVPADPQYGGVVMSTKDFVTLDDIAFHVPSGRLSSAQDGHIDWNFDQGASSELASCYQEPTPQLQISMTDACNLGCSYCSFRDRVRADGKPINMPDETAKKAVSFFRAHIPTHYNTARVDFGLAGEPLLRRSKHNGLASLVDEAFSQPEFEAVWTGTNTTNATLLQSDEDLEAFGPPMDISMDGPKEVHDRHRKYIDGRGSFDDVFRVAKRILAKHPSTSCSTVLTADATDFLAIFLYLTEEVGFNDIYMKPVNTDRSVPYGLNESTLPSFLNGYSEIVNYIIALDAPRKLKTLLKFNHEDYFMRFFRRLKHGAKEQYRCGAGKSGVYVDTNGRLYPCAHFIGKSGWHIGTLGEGFYEEKISEYFSLTVDSREPCKSCWARYLCGGGCYYQAALANGRIDEPDAVKCELIRHLCALSANLLSHLATDHPDVLSALPSSYCLPRARLGANPDEVYRPAAELSVAQSDSNALLELESPRSVEGRLCDPGRSLRLGFTATETLLEIRCVTREDDISCIELDVLQVEEKPFTYRHLKLPLPSYGPKMIRVQKCGNGGWEVLQAQKTEPGAVRKIPFAAPIMTRVDGASAEADENGLTISLPLPHLFGPKYETVGIRLAVHDPVGLRHLVRYEPFCLLYRGARGNLALVAPEIAPPPPPTPIYNRCPIAGWEFLDRWTAIRNNIC